MSITDPYVQVIDEQRENAERAYLQRMAELDAVERIVSALKGESSPWVDRAGAASYLQCSVRTIDNLLADPTALPNTKRLGARVLLLRSDLDAVGSRR